MNFNDERYLLVRKVHGYSNGIPAIIRYYPWTFEALDAMVTVFAGLETTDYMAAFAPMDKTGARKNIRPLSWRRLT